MLVSFVNNQGNFNWGFKCGIQESLFHSNGLSFSISQQIKRESKYGSRNKNLGFVFGMEARSFPIKPLTLRADCYFTTYNSVVNIDTGGTIGFMANRFEFYSGVNFSKILDQPYSNGDEEWNYILRIGTRCYF